MSARGLIIGAPRSGSGKTSVTIGLMRALARRGHTVRGGKSGPDYIDPGFHHAATGQPGVNLDSWAMMPDLLDHLISDQAQASDFLVVESAMGLFDGIRSEPGRSGAAAELARRYSLPTLLVLDISGQSVTSAAVAHGFATFDPQVRIGGVVLNQVASARHEDQARAAIEARGILVVGAVYRNPDMALPERHLGLVQASEHEALEAFIERLADTMEKSLDLEAVIRLAQPVSAGAGAITRALPPPGQRIALASDAAFTFVYPHVSRLWREAGAEIVPFSPLADQAPDESCDTCWLPGGYPELHAGRLAASEHFKAGLRRFAETRAVHGECGGFMVLGQALEDADGVTHHMAGLLGHATSYAKRKLNLGYRQAVLQADCPVGRAGDAVRGHEFHYSRVIDPGHDEPLAQLADGIGNALGLSGARRGHVSGTYFHAIARA
ncbi:cobyrinate a,c-diamide synthase [Tianweitania populi]|uniref:Hydrogenobyrinate a,c-diamide synthase n=1 Tax=Tianweitania populi TaxID=1607949 RepID=A0A8J3GKR2_9HYPH|nr:cobyrinate a,c-diamide synthase [Tianweitania populi]GHD08634.1 hydrogenobyrinate a,c-diamide synthase [Tianweitania populi]